MKQSLTKIKAGLIKRLRLLCGQPALDDIGATNSGDVADAAFATDSMLTSTIVASNRFHEATELRAAIARCDNGTYGTCENCAKLIGSGRLEAIAEARLCISCQAEYDKESM